jgi:Domain of unknown function (DUF6378)/Domain of unknown function (DUF4406)
VTKKKGKDTVIVYISGPMRGKPARNYPQFHEVEEAWLAGHPHDTVFNPAKNFDGDTTLPTETYMQKDLQQVLSANSIVLLPGWERSEYAKLEASAAKATAKNFYFASSIGGSWVFDYAEHADVDFLLDLGSKIEPPESERASLLDEAKSLVCGDRNNSYGPPTQDFERSANSLNAYGYRGPDGRLLKAHDIAIMVMSVKISRLMWTPGKRDSWVDIAGYAACGIECAVEEASREANPHMGPPVHTTEAYKP